MKFDSLKRTEQKCGNEIRVRYFLMLDGHHFSMPVKTVKEIFEKFELIEQPTKIEDFVSASPVRSTIYYQK